MQAKDAVHDDVDTREPESAMADKASAKPQKKGDGKATIGRDETLSEYLASLGAIPLFTAEEEIAYARDLKESETRCWRLVLALDPIAEYICAHPDVDAARKYTGHDVRERVLRRLARAKKTGSLKLSTKASADLDAVAASLRAYDDDRKLIDECIALLGELESERKDGETAAAFKKRATKEAKERAKTLEQVKKERRRALRIRNKFVRANLRLVVSVARRFHHYRMPLIDLIQEGNLGLIKSVHRFDHEKGFRFSTYAHWWIRQAIERAIMNKGAQVRLPVHIFDARREVAKATRELSQRMGREPTLDELADALCMPLDKLEDIRKAVPRDPQSLDDPIGDDEDRTLGESICDPGAMLPDESVISVDQANHVRSVVRGLTPMEVDIIERRFGLKGRSDETLEEIGKSYNLSRERVRQIQVQGLKKMQKTCERRSVSV